MKWIFLSLLISFELHAACSSISRSAATASSILTSSKYNTDLNTVYNFVNAYDGGCISSGTVEAAALNSTEFGPILKAIVQGCEVSYSDSNTVSVSKCKIAVDGNLFETSSANTVTWGCSGCSSEATGSFYVYVKDTPTFTLSISSTAPGKDGYNSTDKVVGSFYNDPSLTIATASVNTWVNSGFMPNPENVLRGGSKYTLVSATVSSSGAVSSESEDFINGNCTNANPMVCSFQNNYFSATPNCWYKVESGSQGYCYGTDSQSSTSIGCTDDGSTITVLNITKKLYCYGPRSGN